MNSFFLQCKHCSEEQRHKFPEIVSYIANGTNKYVFLYESTGDPDGELDNCVIIKEKINIKDLLEKFKSTAKNYNGYHGFIFNSNILQTIFDGGGSCSRRIIYNLKDDDLKVIKSFIEDKNNSDINFIIK